MRCYIYIWLFFFLLSCNSKTKDLNNQYFLLPSDQYVSFPIPDNTALPYDGIKTFNVDGKEYLAFDGSDHRSLYIYDIQSKNLVKHILYEAEGDEGIKGISEFYIEDFDHIYLSSYYPVIFRTDTAGHILQKINYAHTTDTPSIELRSTSSIMGSIVVLGQQIYIPTNINPAFGNELIEKSKVGVVIDTVSHSVEQLPLGFPPLITYQDIGTGTGSGYGCYYNRCFDGNSFVYGFLYNDLMYKTSIDHKKVIRKKVKSHYAPNIDVFHIKETSSFNEHLKIEAETSIYGDCVYDPYHKVYYRFAYPSSELEKNDSYVEILRNGRKQPSIMILNEDLEILGETLLPEFTYASRAYFVREDGLYLSVSHFKREDYSEDTLRFQRLELVTNKDK
ncbi:MAG: DUF4221 family protein [Parabacteroides sp.]|nr:DUF4221 family protein [Parabacteroides sp.]